MTIYFGPSNDSRESTLEVSLLTDDRPIIKIDDCGSVICIYLDSFESFVSSVRKYIASTSEERGRDAYLKINPGCDWDSLDYETKSKWRSLFE